MHRVVIIGGGFGGLKAASALRGAPLQVTLVDQRNHHLFQPLLYQVATGALSPANIASPLRTLFQRQTNLRVLLDRVVDIDPERHRVITADSSLIYDSLIIAAGSSHSYFGHPEWAAIAPGLKTLDDATEIRRRLLSAFEIAEKLPEPAVVENYLTFVIVGAGPTGVELAGAVIDIARHSLVNEFRNIDPATARVILVEAADRVLPQYPPELSAKAHQGLVTLGVDVRTSTPVLDVNQDSVLLKHGEHFERVHTKTVLWAAGVQASPLGKVLARSLDLELDRAGRVIVEPDLTVPGHPEIFVIGDLAHLRQADGKPLPALAPVAQQQGRYAAQLIRRRLQGKTLEPFKYSDWGTMATIGRGWAVADVRGHHFAGAVAWLMWLFVHLMQIVQFQNRILVLIQWAWNYFTRDRSAMLITGPPVPTTVELELVQDLELSRASRQAVGVDSERDNGRQGAD